MEVKKKGLGKHRKYRLMGEKLEVGLNKFPFTRETEKKREGGGGGKWGKHTGKK